MGRGDRGPLLDQPLQGGRGRRTPGEPPACGGGEAEALLRVRLRGRRSGEALLLAPGLRARVRSICPGGQVGRLRRATSRACRVLPTRPPPRARGFVMATALRAL